MCHHSSRESLLSFGIPEITRGLRRKGYTWHKIDLLFKPDAKLNFVEIPWEWTTTSGGYLNRTEKKSSVKVYIRKDFSGLYLEIKYTLQRTLKAGEIRNEISTRYDLTKRESNLKPGTYRPGLSSNHTESSTHSKGKDTRRGICLPPGRHQRPNTESPTTGDGSLLSGRGTRRSAESWIIGGLCLQ